MVAVLVFKVRFDAPPASGQELQGWCWAQQGHLIPGHAPLPFSLQQVIPIPQLTPGLLSCKSHITHRRCLFAVKTNFTLTVQD